MDNHNFSWINQLQTAMFNTYVCLPEGKIAVADHLYLHQLPSQPRFLFTGGHHGPATPAERRRCHGWVPRWTKAESATESPGAQQKWHEAVPNLHSSLSFTYCGWLQNPAPSWMVESLEIVKCLPPINWWFGVRNHPPYVTLTLTTYIGSVWANKDRS